jgi:hypothetical protein
MNYLKRRKKENKTMTAKEWAKAYPAIASALFECAVDELDSVLEEKPVDTNEIGYMTKSDVDRLFEILDQEGKIYTVKERE